MSNDALTTAIEELKNKKTSADFDLGRINRGNLDFFNDINGCFIAGGSVLSSFMKSGVVNDIDIYPKNVEGRKDAAIFLEENLPNAMIMSISDKAITYISGGEVNPKTDKAFTVQIMIFDYFETADKIFDYFDFTCCMGAYDTDTTEYILHPMFLKDVAARELRYSKNTKFPFNSLMRIEKYKSKGFRISNSTFVQMILNVEKELKNLENWNDLAKILGGAYGIPVDFKEEEMPDFSLDNAIDYFANFDFDAVTKTDFSKRVNTGFDSAEYIMIVDSPIEDADGPGEYFFLGDGHFGNGLLKFKNKNGDDVLKKVSTNSTISAEDFVNKYLPGWKKMDENETFFTYKNVIKSDECGGMHSVYAKNYVYKPNTWHYPALSYNYLWAGKFSKRGESPLYGSEKKNAIPIKVAFCAKDIVSIGAFDLKLRRLFFVDCAIDREIMIPDIKKMGEDIPFLPNNDPDLKLLLTGGNK